MGISKDNLTVIITALNKSISELQAKIDAETDAEKIASYKKKIAKYQSAIDDISSSETGVPTKDENGWVIGAFQSNFDWTPESKKVLQQIAHIKNMIYLPDANHLVPDKNDHLENVGFNEDYINTTKQALVKYGEVQIGYSAISQSKPYYYNKEHKIGRAHV